jgi:hypothetical protein
MLIELDKRVGVLENQIGGIRVDLAKLTVRSEQFATKKDIQDLRVEIHQAMGAINKDFSTIYREIAAQTKWLAATLIGVAAMCMIAAKLLF